jgi:hypothetical protein
LSATSISIEDPDHARIAACLLRHRTFSTTLKYYNQARMIEAARLMQDLLLSLRRGDVTIAIPSSTEEAESKFPTRGSQR